jgi:acetamidase/formamidase
MTIPSSDISDMGWTTKEEITYIDEVYQGKVPLLYQFGCMGLPPASHDFVTTIIPMPTGGNLDSKRIGKGITMYYPVEIAGALFSVGDGHTGQGDSELAGTGIETSLTGEFRFTVIKQADFTESQKVVDFPLGETNDEYIVHG